MGRKEQLELLYLLVRGIEKKHIVLDPWYGEVDPEYPKQNKEAMLLELEMAIKTTEYMFKENGTQ